MDDSDILEFGIKRENEERRDGGFAIVFSPNKQQYAVAKQHDNGSFRLFSGGIDDGEDMVQGTCREVTEESGLQNFKYVEDMGKSITHYFNTLRQVNRVAHATCVLIILENEELCETCLEDHEKFDLVWADAQEILDDMVARNENKDNDHWIHYFKKSVNRAIELGFDTTSSVL